MPLATKGVINYKQPEFEEGQDLEEAAIDGFSNHMKLLSKTKEVGDHGDEVNESEEFDGEHYFVVSFCFTGVSGSCVIPTPARSASNLIPGGICPGYLFPFFSFFRHF